MTKKDLVESLKNVPGDAEVMIWRCDDSAPWSIKRTKINGVHYNDENNIIELEEL